MAAKVVWEVMAGSACLSRSTKAAADSLDSFCMSHVGACSSGGQMFSVGPTISLL